MTEILDDAVYLWPLKWGARQVRALLSDSAETYGVTDSADENAPAELRSNALGDDRTDLSLKARSDAYEQADSLNWLLEGSDISPQDMGSGDKGRDGPPLAPKSIKPGEEHLNFHFGAPPKVSAIHDAVARQFREGDDRVEQPAAPALDEGLLNTSGGAMVMEMVRQFADPVGSLRQDLTAASDAGLLPSNKTVALGLAELPRQMVGGVRDAITSTNEFFDWMEQHGAEILPGRRITRKAWERLGISELPEVGPARTMAGSAVRAVTQMVVPYGR